MPSHDSLDPRHHLIRMAWLGDPVVGSEPEPRDALSDRRALRTDDHAEIRKHAADPLDEFPGQRTQEQRIDHEGVQLHRRQLLRRHRAREDPILAARSLESLDEDPYESRVVVDDGYSECSGLGSHVLWPRG